MQQVLFLRQKTFYTQFKIPKIITHELPHNHSRNPRHAHPLPCVGPYRNTCNNSKPFPDILNIVEVLSSRFFRFSSFNQVLLLSIYNTQSLNPTHTFHSSRKSNNLTFLHHQKTPVHFFSLHQISSTSSHLLTSLKPFCQSSCRNMIHRAHEEFSLSSRN
jgi:hypothetical protein